MAKKRSKEKRRIPAAVEAAAESAKKKREARGGAQQTTGGNSIGEFFASKGVRETIESIAIAFILAFLFRTFEAEAFVIPTGSMAETLRGQHKEVACEKCGYVHLAGGSEGNVEMDGDVVASTCPVCRYVNRFAPDSTEAPYATGDRILVSKFVYDLDDPERWDVVVFKFPFNAKQNYIKRLVGRSGEDLRISGGDIWTRPLGSDEEYTIARKPPEKILAMMQVVHDTDYVPAALAEAGWPSRWRKDSDQDENGWRPIDNTLSHGGRTLLRRDFHIEHDAGDEPAWLRYHHYTPREEDWRDAARGRVAPPDKMLITDFTAYNAMMYDDRGLWRRAKYKAYGYEAMGLHWVGDLALEVDVEVEGDKGTLLLDLVEAGRHFQCAIDLSDGTATLSIVDLDGAPGVFTDHTDGNAQAAVTGKAGVGKGSHHLRFANVDNQLTLWVNNQVISFDGPTAYRAADQLTPQWNDGDAGDLAPAGVGSQGATLTVRRLKVLRDVYYIAVDFVSIHDERQYPGNVLMDYRPNLIRDTMMTVRDVLDHPEKNRREQPLIFDDVFTSRRAVEFDIPEDHFFTLGDNSAQSQDARIWHREEHFVHRNYMIGKALFIYWPYAKGPIYLPNPWDYGQLTMPIVPNFQRMRFVR